MEAALYIPADVARSALVYAANGHPLDEAIRMAAAEAGLCGMVREEKVDPLVFELA